MPLRFWLEHASKETALKTQEWEGDQIQNDLQLSPDWVHLNKDRNPWWVLMNKEINLPSSTNYAEVRY